jgi:16S rRNA processing protein RimM
VELLVGRIGRAHGIRGDVLIDVRTDSPDERFAVGSALRTDPPGVGPLVVEAAKWHSGRLVVHLGGVEDRSSAEALRGTRIVVDSAAIPAPDDPDEFLDHQLIGLAAITVTGQPVGIVATVVHGPGGDLLVVDRADGGEALVPFVREIVPEVDLPGGRLLVDPPDGLL